jgi:alkanesulfonate monooxygenase SsuD/methylene tetrahydromethanopterin reductase-like flavin-dependent oxidoreductase (luciferase family)
MRFGLTLPIFDRLADPSLLADLAVEAEAAGWDAVFVWDHIRYRLPAEAVTDPWIAMAAMAARTDRVLLGPMVTPLARRRPHVLARQLVALDHLSRGRIVFGVGLGIDGASGEFAALGDETDARRRAAMLDEGLGLLEGLLSGEEVDHHGEHYTASNVRFVPTPMQEPLPIWVAGRWPNPRPLRRAARYDGAFVIDLTPADLPSVIAAIEAAAADAGVPLRRGYDIVVEDAPGADPKPWADAGATWLLTSFDPFTVGPEQVRAAIANRP